MTDTATPVLTPPAAPDPTPVLPPIPTSWTPASVATYAGAIALFVLGALTSAGVIVPAGVSSEVQLVVGSLGALSGVVTSVVALLSHHSVQKTAIKAAAPLVPKV